MKKAGVTVDNYKLKIFRRNLKNAGFEWTESILTKKSMLMVVAYKEEDFSALLNIVKESNILGRREKGK